MESTNWAPAPPLISGTVLANCAVAGCQVCGLTALQLAADQGYVEALGMLVTAGADPNIATVGVCFFSCTGSFEGGGASM